MFRITANDVFLKKCVVKNKLKDTLEERGIKQVWLAERIGIDKRTLSNIINNRFNTSLEVALKIALLLNMKIEDLFYLSIDEKENV